ncbi:DUF2800 domain-containing protein [Agathobaculum sp. NTUH-O15-33]|uniref:DUF2800 domain-containing protein n=1 Tax=Agathobaculum sp. NTUH-O15-33 TaxID=3079302 RepID=UPI002958592D|nr:DUF2800 domain-containing protein [Agathobaculum sp. NTUH-O15-33]WNX84387.1 DUF2800 domain-containing protein [Agathobaculum sp. NTUH-O15-33]
MPDKHALLGPSSSHRWLNCPPSARLSEQFPDTGSSFAAAGTLAHEIAELKARKHFIEPMGVRTYNARMKKLKADPRYDPGMDDATDQYLEHLKALAMIFVSPPFVALETQVDYSYLVPEGFGTADCIMIGGGKMCVVDYKNGSGVPVDAVDNSQMMLYALGALHVYAPIYGDTIHTIHLSIVQPNAGGVKEWEASREALDLWAENYVRPQAVLAWEGKGEFNPGEWCEKNFCPARSQCTARAKKMLELEPLQGAVPEELAASAINEPSAPLLTDAEVGDILTRAISLEAWVKDLKNYALTATLEGREVAGWKAVEGRGSRDWNDVDAAFAALQEHGIAEALLYERKPVSVAGLEKTLGKKDFAETAEGLWTKSPGKPALAPETDPRKPYTPAEAAFNPTQNEKENT